MHFSMEMEDVMSSSLGALGPLLRKLDEFPDPGCCRQSRLLKNEIELLKKDLDDIAPLLVDLSKVESPDLTSKCWMEEVRELSYDNEDFIDKITPVRSKADGTAGSGCRHLPRVGRVIVARLPAMRRWIARFTQLTTQVRKAAMRSSLDAMVPIVRKLNKLPVAECCRQAKLLKNGIKILKDYLRGMNPSLVELSEVKASDSSFPSGTTGRGCGHLRRIGRRLVVSRLPTMRAWTMSVAQFRSLFQEAGERQKRYQLESCLLKKEKSESSHDSSSTFVFTSQRPPVPTLDGQATTRLATSKGKAKTKIRPRSGGLSVGHLKIDMLCKALKSRKIADIKERLRTLMRVETELQARFTRQRQQVRTVHEDAANIVRIDDSRIKHTKWWLEKDSEKQLKVVSILGPAGIGKTTFAKQLYRELGGQADCQAFVRASRKPDAKGLLADILAQVQRHQRPAYASTVQKLYGSLKEHLKNKRYVIVIDDLWETATWGIVSGAFPEGNSCSRIITTTEIKDIALHCCGQPDYLFTMDTLIDDESILLFNRVFGSEHQHNKELKKASHEIIHKCGGLPLAITSIAKHLASQPDKSEKLFQVKECLCNILGENTTFALREILNLSYNSLPHHLKTCMLYLNIFPEGYTIWKDKLVKQWIAEGFVIETPGKDMEEVAESYFDELVSRGMIQPDIKPSGGVLSCTVHHMVYQIIKHKSKEENLITSVDYPLTNSGLSTKVRRLSLQLRSANHARKMTGINMPQVRSLVFFGLLECMPSIMGFKHLRVLVLDLWDGHDGFKSCKLTGIFRLFQLRYLKITCDTRVELPPQVEALQYLKTMEVEAREITVPSGTFHFPALSHLRVGGWTKLPDGIGQITSLHTLQCFDICENSKSNVLGLGDLTNLQDLHITCSNTAPLNANDILESKLAALASSLGKLSNLSSLTLAPAHTSGTGPGITPLQGPMSVPCPPVSLRRLELLPPACVFSRLPRWIGQLRELRVLKIVARELLKDDIDILNGLSALTVLSLDVQVARLATVVVKPAFPALKYFRYRCRALCMAFRAGAMRSLRKLKLCFSAQKGKKYGRMLAGIENLRNLQEIAARIATTAGADQSDRVTAVSAFREAIEASKQKRDAIQDPEATSKANCEHRPRSFPSFRVKWVDRDEDAIYGPPKQSRRMHEEEGPSVIELTTVDGDGGCRIIDFPAALLPVVMSHTAPVDVCRSAAVCRAFRIAASYTVWDRFFPQDYRSIMARATCPVDFDFAATKKELFFCLSEQHFLIDDGKKSFWLERTSGAKCYMVASRSLHITWGDKPQYWSWIPGTHNSRFEEVAELIDVCWLDIVAIIDCRELSLHTRYTAYLVFNLTNGYGGLDRRTQESVITIAGEELTKHVVSLHRPTMSGRQSRRTMRYWHEDEPEESTVRVKHPRRRRDSWMEVELGEFYNGNLDDGEVRIQLREHETLNWKSGLIVEGVEIRPTISG